MQWANWVSGQNCIIKQTDTMGKFVSTVFLGIDHNFTGKGKPVLFETMVFDQDGTPMDCQRFNTWEDAEENHQLTVDALSLKDFFSTEVGRGQ